MLTVSEVKRSKMSHFLMTEFAIYFSTAKSRIGRSLFGGCSSKGALKTQHSSIQGRLSSTEGAAASMEQGEREATDTPAAKWGD